MIEGRCSGVSVWMGACGRKRARKTRAGNEYSTESRRTSSYKTLIFSDRASGNKGSFKTDIITVGKGHFGASVGIKTGSLNYNNREKHTFWIR